MKIGLTTLLFLVGVSAGQARELWVLAGHIRGAADRCAMVSVWKTDTVFYNLTDTKANVKFLHQSNSLDWQLPPSVIIAPGETVAISRLVGDLPPQGLSALVIDVPDQVHVENRLEYRFDSPCAGFPQADGPAGKVALPVFDSLVPAGQPQMHFGTDLGLQNSHVNVGIYNGGSITAHATIDLHVPFMGADPVASVTVDIPRDTVAQLTMPSPSPRQGAGAVPRWVAYTVVTADQPSFSYVSVNSNVQTPNVSIAIGSSN